VYIHTHTHTHARTHARTHASTHARTHTHTHTHSLTHTHSHTHTHTQTHTLTPHTFKHVHLHMYTYTYIHTCDSSLSSGVSLRSLPTLDNDLTGPTMEDGLAGGVNLSNGGVPFEEHTATHSSRPRPTRCATPPPPAIRPRPASRSLHRCTRPCVPPSCIDAGPPEAYPLYRVRAVSSEVSAK